jgi:hypothetical protein
MFYSLRKSSIKFDHPRTRLQPTPHPLTFGKLPFELFSSLSESLFALAMLHVIFEVAFVDFATLALQGAVTLPGALAEISLVGIAVGPDVLALPVRFSFEVLAYVTVPV